MSTPDWQGPFPYGYPDAIDTASTVAAPLLAGFSFGLIALTIPGDGIKWPAVAQALFVASGLLFILAVQAGFWARQWVIRPSDLAEWHPHDSPKRMHAEQRLHRRGFDIWAPRFRWTYRAALLSLLTGVVFMVVPPGNVHGSKWLAIVAASIGWLAEALWIFAGWVLRTSPVALYTGQPDAPRPGTPFISVRGFRPVRWFARKVQPLVSVDP